METPATTQPDTSLAPGRAASRLAPPGGRRPRVVVVGAGFAGLHVVRGLAKEPVDVLLIDRHNYHL